MEKYSKATFLNWLELDNELEEWAAGYFGRYVRTSGYRDGQSMYVCVHLKPDDKQKYVDLVKDSEEIGTEPNQAWETFNEDVEPLLPEDTSMKIMSEILGWDVSTECANEDGVYFLHSAAKDGEYEPVVKTNHGVLAVAHCEDPNYPGIWVGLRKNGCSEYIDLGKIEECVPDDVVQAVLYPDGCGDDNHVKETLVRLKGGD